MSKGCHSQCPCANTYLGLGFQVRVQRHWQSACAPKFENPILLASAKAPCHRPCAQACACMHFSSFCGLGFLAFYGLACWENTLVLELFPFPIKNSPAPPFSTLFLSSSSTLPLVFGFPLHPQHFPTSPSLSKCGQDLRVIDIGVGCSKKPPLGTG